MILELLIQVQQRCYSHLRDRHCRQQNYKEKRDKGSCGTACENTEYHHHQQQTEWLWVWCYCCSLYTSFDKREAVVLKEQEEEEKQSFKSHRRNFDREDHQPITTSHVHVCRWRGGTGNFDDDDDQDDYVFYRQNQYNSVQFVMLMLSLLLWPPAIINVVVNTQFSSGSSAVAAGQGERSQVS